MAITIVPAVQIHALYAFAWRDCGECELYAADVEALRSVRRSHIDAAGLPLEATLRAISVEVPRLATDDTARGFASCRPRGYSLMLVIDGRTGAILESWLAVDPWLIVARRLGKAVA